MSTDSQGRPLSDDGQWAWSGTEWVPAAAPVEPAAPQTEEPEDVGATMIAPSPFAAGGVASEPAYAGTPQPGYGSTTPASQDNVVSYGTSQADPGYGATPGYGPGAAPAAGSVPAQRKSRRPLILGIVAALVVIAAIVVVLILVLGGDSKSKLAGKFTCTVAGQSGTASVTFNGDKYTLSDQGKGGTYDKDGNTVTFKGGTLNGIKGSYDSGAKTVKFTYRSFPLVCKHA